MVNTHLQLHLLLLDFLPVVQVAGSNYTTNQCCVSG
jgi:hypothetical protein